MGSGKINKQLQAVEISSGSPSPDRQSWDRGTADGPPGEQAAACVRELSRRPGHWAARRHRQCSANGGRARQPPTRQRLLDPPGPQRAGSQEAGDPAPLAWGPWWVPTLKSLGLHRRGGAYLAWGSRSWAGSQLELASRLDPWSSLQEELMRIRAWGPDTPGAFPTVSSRRLLSTNDMLGPALSSTIGMEKLKIQRAFCGGARGKPGLWPSSPYCRALPETWEAPPGCLH